MAGKPALIEVLCYLWTISGLSGMSFERQFVRAIIRAAKDMDRAAARAAKARLQAARAAERERDRLVREQHRVAIVHHRAELKRQREAGKREREAARLQKKLDKEALDALKAMEKAAFESRIARRTFAREEVVNQMLR